MATYQQLVDGMRTAMQSGQTGIAQALAKKIENKEYEEESSAVASALQGFGQGATLGFGDEAAAAIRAGLGEFTDKTLGATMYGLGIGVDGEGSFGERFRQYRELAEDERPLMERYATALESQRGALETARREDPWTTGIAEAVGGLGQGGIGAGRAVAGRGLAAGARNLMGTGALLGATGGYGYGEGDVLATAAGADLRTDLEKLQDQAMGAEAPSQLRREAGQAAVGAGTGAVIGGTLGGVMPYAGAALRGMASFVAKPFTRNARLREEGRRAVMNALDDDIASGHYTLEQAERELRSTPGMTPADLGPAMRELAETAAQQPTPGGRVIREVLTERNREQWSRMFPKLSEAIGAQDNFGAARRALVSQMEEQADRLYTQAYARNIRVTPRMQNLMRLDEFKPALDTANRLRSLAGKDPLPEVPRAGTMMNTKELDNLLQGMDDVVTAAFKDAPAVARVIKPLRNEFRELLYEDNPALRQARQAWAGDTLNNEAMDKGLRVLRDDADITSEIIRDMSQSELAFFKIGALRAFARRLGNKSDTSDLTKGLFDRPNTREALRVAFGSRRAFEEFMQYVSQEQKMFNTFNQAVGNSATARRMAQQQGDAAGKLAGVIGFGTTGSLLVAGAARRMYNALSPTMRRQQWAQDVSQPQANLLMGQGTDALQNIMRPTQLGGLLGTGAQPTVGRGVGTAMATGLLQPETEYGGF